MKYLLLILCFVCFAQNKIEVFRISDNKLIAGDRGLKVTITSLRKKMLKKNIDISNKRYRIKITNIRALKEAEIKNKLRKKNIKDKLKSDYISGLIDLSKKEDLTRAVEFLLEQHGAF